MKKIFNCIYLLIFIAAALALSMVFRSYAAALAAICAAACAVFDALTFIALAPFVRLEITADKPVIKKNGAFRAYIKIVNKTPLILPVCKIKLKVKNFYYAERIQKITASAFAFFGGTVKADVECTHSGNVTVSVQSAEIYSFFGTVSKKIRCKESSTVCVLPMEYSVDVECAPSSAESDVPLAAQTKADYGDADGVRSYIPGDRLNNIHWKLSAANGGDSLFVREFSENTEDVIIVLFEYYINNVDSILDNTYSVCVQLLKMNKGFTLMWVNGGYEDAQMRTIADRHDLDEAFAQLYTFCPSQTDTAAIDYFRKITGGESCIYIDGSAADR